MTTEQTQQAQIELSFVPSAGQTGWKPKDDSTDEDLFFHFAETDCQRSFAHIHKRYEPRIKGFILKRIGDEAQADDLTQQVFMRMHRARNQYDPTKSFSTWSHTIANNVLKNHYRSVSRNRLHNFTDMAPRLSNKLRKDSDPVFDAPSREKSPEENTYLEELRATLEESVGALDSAHRDPFIKHQLEGLSYEEVSGDLNIPLGTVKSRTHRARALLRDSLQMFVEG